MNLINKYSNRTDYLVLDNQLNDLLDSSYPFKSKNILSTERGYGKTHFLIYKSLKEAALNKKVLLVVSNYNQSRLIKSMFNTTLNNYRIDNAIMNNIQITVLNKNNIRGYNFNNYDFIFVDDAEFIDYSILEVLEQYMTKSTLIFVLSKESFARGRERYASFIDHFSAFNLIDIIDEQYKESIRQIQESVGRVITYGL